MKIKITVNIIFFVFFFTVHAQVKVGDNPASMNTSAVLDVESTTKGFLPPRMTDAQMTAIASPAKGLIVYCTNCTTEGLMQNVGTPAAPNWSSVSSNNNVGNDCNTWNNNTASGISGTGVSRIIDLNTIRTEFPYTGSLQTAVAPPGTTQVYIVAWGAGGGGGWVSGGSGGFTAGRSNTVAPLYNIIVGQGGFPHCGTPQSRNYAYGGGASGSSGECDVSSGGGRSSVSTPTQEILVAGGGGSGGGLGGNGGAGGGINGNAAPGGGGNGGGASQSIGGSSQVSVGLKDVGGFGWNSGGGGGGGYYGGGGGNGAGTGGGGGSSFVSTGLFDTMNLAGTNGNGFNSNPPQTTNADYLSRVGIGGAPQWDGNYQRSGGNGRVVIYWIK